MSCFACKPSAPVEVDSDKVILFFKFHTADPEGFR